MAVPVSKPCGSASGSGFGIAEEMAVPRTAAMESDFVKSIMMVGESSGAQNVGRNGGKVCGRVL